MSFIYRNKCDWSQISPNFLKLLGKLRFIAGTEVRDLPSNHFLAQNGEQGLFAIKNFKKFDIIGEYVGEVVSREVSGHYVACLEDTDNLLDSLGVDASRSGNETRFINSYLNISFAPNVMMKRCYINSVPHIFIVCIEDIEIGDEILLDYGESYNTMYLTCEKTTDKS
jgi:SET domain-containing protein